MFQTSVQSGKKYWHSIRKGVMTAVEL